MFTHQMFAVWTLLWQIAGSIITIYFAYLLSIYEALALAVAQLILLSVLFMQVAWLSSSTLIAYSKESCSVLTWACTLMRGFINTDYSQIISYSVTRQQTRFINLKSQFIL